MANLCDFTLSGMYLDCASMAGVKKVYISQNEYTPTIENNKITEIGGKSGEWFEYRFRPQTASMEIVLNKDATVGSAYYTTQLTMSFNKMDTAKRLEMSALFIGQFSVIVLDQNETYWFLGLSNPVEAVDGGGGTGLNFNDANGYNIVLQDLSRKIPYEIDADAVLEVI